ncbi:MAG: YdbL family protein [Litorimonas sp.]
MMKKIIIGALTAVALLGGTSAVLTLSGENAAHAQSAKSLVDTAKSRGEVGEQIDGYLGIVSGKSPSAAVRSAVQEINIGRKSVYTNRARKENVTVEAIAASIGVKQLQKARSGETVRDASGQWKKK